MFIALIAVMVSQVYAYVEIHQLVCFNCAQFSTNYTSGKLIKKIGGSDRTPPHAETSRLSLTLTRSGSQFWVVLPLTEACQPAAGTQLVPRGHALL